MKRNAPRNTTLFALLTGVVVYSFSAHSADPEIERVMKERHEKFERMGEAFDEIDMEIKRSTPDVDLIQKHAVQIDEWAQDQFHWFPEGSGPESGIKTKAKSEIWSRLDDFRGLQEAFVAEAGKLKSAAVERDVTNLASQVHATGEVCSSCHETYRKKSSLFSIFGL
jgi:cytochrome c556